MFRRTNLVVSAFAVAAVGLGCGGTVLDDAKTEEQLRQNIKSLGKNVTAVDCPSGVDVEPGETFECTVRLAGGKEETAKLRIVNEDADVEVLKLNGGE